MKSCLSILHASSFYGRRKLLEALKFSIESRARYHHRNPYVAKYKK